MNSKNERRVSLLEGPEPGPVVPLDTWDASHRLGVSMPSPTRHQAQSHTLLTGRCHNPVWWVDLAPLPVKRQRHGAGAGSANPAVKELGSEASDRGLFHSDWAKQVKGSQAGSISKAWRPEDTGIRGEGSFCQRRARRTPPNRVTPLSPPEAQQRRPSSKKNPLLSLEPPWCPGFGWCLAHSLAPTNGSLRALRLLCSFPPWSPHTGPRRQEARECQTTSVSPDTIRACGERPSGHKCRDA